MWNQFCNWVKHFLILAITFKSDQVKIFSIKKFTNEILKSLMYFMQNHLFQHSVNPTFALQTQKIIAR